jgi:hypothetical protein
MFFKNWDRKYPDSELVWHSCETPIIPRRTVEGGWTSSKLNSGKTWRRRGHGGRWEYRQDLQSEDDWANDQW